MADLNHKTVLIFGAGPRIIGQSAECDESAVQAALALIDQGCRIITVNSNPDAITTAPRWAYRSYLEPLTAENLVQIIAAEKPDALLPTFGGRHGLHLATELTRMGILEKHRIDLWHLSSRTLRHLLNRDTLNTALSEIGLNTPSIFVVDSASSAAEKAQELGFPVVLRHSNADLMPDGVLVYNQDELRECAMPGSSDNHGAVTIEASLLTWQQVELEILRDMDGDIVTAGTVEYIDTAGIHPGDAVAVCPPQSLSADIIDRLTAHAGSIAGHLNLVGGATIRFAYRPSDHSVLVLAVHPRYTRTSAFVARVTGLPLAGLSGLLAAGYKWNQLPAPFGRPKADPRPSTAAKRNPVGVKWPCWDFERLKATADRLGPQMRAVGQHLGLGHDFKEALQKAARASAEYDLGLSNPVAFREYATEELLAALSTPSSQRLPMVCEAMRRGISETELNRLTHFAPWFLKQFKALVDMEAMIARHQGQMLPKSLLQQVKAAGFSNASLTALLKVSAQDLASQFADYNLRPNWQKPSGTEGSLRFSTYGPGSDLPPVAGDRKIIIIGCGAYRIGQGSECDFGIFQATEAVRSQGYIPVLLNHNLAGISTGQAMQADCYCEPITAESILDVIAKEKPYGVITQFAGLRSSALAGFLVESGVNVLGPPLSSLQLVNDRPAFKNRMRELGIPQPAGGVANTAEEMAGIVAETGYPIQVRAIHSDGENRYVLLQDEAELQCYLTGAGHSALFPLMVEQFLEYAIEAQAETLCDGQNALVVAVMEHIELAGVHAGDSACVMPPYSIAPRHVETISEYCRKTAAALAIKGLLNLRFAIYRDTVYLLEAGCNISRNLSTVERVHRVPLAGMATRLMLGCAMDDLPDSSGKPSWIGVRSAVFPFTVFKAEDPLLGPQMRSIGQVLSMADSFGMAYFKSQEAAATPLPTKGTVLITVTNEDKASILEPARIFQELGFEIMATRGTLNALTANGIEARQVRKLGFGRPNLLDEIKNGQVQLVINTPTGGQGQIDDSIIRRTAIHYRVANVTTPASALAAAKGIAAQRKGKDIARPLVEE